MYYRARSAEFGYSSPEVIPLVVLMSVHSLLSVRSVEDLLWSALPGGLTSRRPETRITPYGAEILFQSGELRRQLS
jgi:hypothetical protein